MLAYLEQRYEAAQEKAAFQTLMQVHQHTGRATEDLLAPARERIEAEGGLSHDHVVGLGYRDLADFYERSREQG